jgi:hypothetical protein
MVRGAIIDGIRSVLHILCHMRSCMEAWSLFDKFPGVVGFVTPNGNSALFRQFSKHINRGLPFCLAGGLRDAGVNCKAASVFHQQVSQAAQSRFLTFGFLVQPGIRIRRRLMSVVRSFFPFENQRSDFRDRQKNYST